ncbi:MAG: ISAs1 family transposase [Thermomicrobiales bacterium]|nr:ISAs1 family transposase [Thermomicrobiales bacterium]
MSAPDLYPVPTIAAAFSEVVDPRDGPAMKHQLLDILTIAICAILCGEDDWVGVEEWAEIREAELTAWLGLEHGVPSHDTFGRVFAQIDPVQFEAGFYRWVRESLPDRPAAGVIAIDGKTARRSGDPQREQSPLHLVTAYAVEQRLVIGQNAVGSKANEITVIPALLERLVLKGQVITIDAMGCQRSFAEQIVAGGGDYVLAVKGNQGALLEGVVDTFALAPQDTEVDIVEHQTIDKGHGRLETRTCAVIADPAVIAWLNPAQQWPGLQSIIRITATRASVGATGGSHHQYPLLHQQPPPDAVRLNQVIRSHWAIENEVHWVLDMIYREDSSRVRRGYAQQNLAVIRN